VKQRRTWPLFLIGLPAAVAVWSGWVGLGGMCGFGIIHPLPGIADSFQLNTAITLPIGVEAYGGYALGVWADLATPQRVRRFAFWSALGSLALGLLGQVLYHLLVAAGYAHAPWLVTMFVSCIPVAAIGFGMGLHQLLIHTEADGQDLADAGAIPARTTAELFSEMARTITPVPETPDPGPDGPLPEGPGPDSPPWADEALAMFDADRAGESQEDEADTGEPDRAGEPEEDTREADRPHEPEADKKAAARRLRADHPDLTQKDIASRLEVTDRTVRRWLNPPAPARALVTANGHSARTHEES
jgi:hypothetical protein